MPQPDRRAEGGVVNTSGAKPELLRALAESDSLRPGPYDFAHFKQREARVLQQRRARGLLPARATALAATLSAVLIGAALWRSVGVSLVPVQSPTTAPRVATAAPSVAADESPALVSAGHQVVRAQLEERIALIDAMLSESRVSGEQPENLRAMEAGRSTLVDSLQRVSYAQQLVEP